MMQKPWKIIETLGTDLRVLSKRFPMNTNMTRFKIVCVLVLWTKVASVLEGLIDARRIEKAVYLNMSYK